MPRSRKRLVYFEPDIDAKIEERAQAMGLSVNEWINRVTIHALASKDKRLRITTIREVDL